MPADMPRVKELFLAAADRPPAERAAFLDQACGADTDLRRRVDALLAAHDAPGGPLGQAPPAADDSTAAYHPADAAGAVIAGKYKLLEPIGEGGMGEVWMAQQTDPVKRLVALKLIKPGMDTRAVLARFEAERQALALMDHPNIAKVFDGGLIPGVRSQESGVRRDDLTPDSWLLTPGAGRPFFVMELVRGTPITEYCDDHHLTPKERLALFIPVCQAVQHAHQKGVIHRDLKPTNVLVGVYDGRPVPKVIDFGVAKAAGPALTEKTLFTGFGAVVGTPEYMSPEQARMDNLDIDTRTDVYSLGVLLYELLVGSPPFRRTELEKAGLLEILRVIREVDPPKPSTKLSTTAALPTIAANRHTEPKRLAALVRGELDWIVMKALEKDRNRRYETATGLAADVQRYLADEPVVAGPPTAAYRLRKFVRRNRARVTVAVALLVALVGGVVGTTWGLVRAERFRRDEADQRRTAERLQREADAERRKAEYQAASIAVDLDLAAHETRETKAGLLRLARRLRTLPADATALREYVMMSVFGWGQEFARIAPGPDYPGGVLGPDGRTLFRTDPVAGDELRDVLSGRRVAALWDTDRSDWFFQFGPDGRAGVAFTRRLARAWDLGTRSVRAEIRPGGGALHAAYPGPDGDRVVTASDPELTTYDPRRATLVQLFDGRTGRLVARLDHGGRPLRLCRFSPDGRTILTAAGPTARAWSAADGRLLGTLAGHGSDVGEAAFSPSGRRAVTGDKDRVHWWRTADWQPDGAPCELVFTGQPNARDWLQATFLHDDVLAVYLTGTEGRDTVGHTNLCVHGEARAYELKAIASDGRRVLTDDDRVYGLRPLRRLELPPGQKYPPEFRRRAIGGRFLHVPEVWVYDRLIDLAVEKPFPFRLRAAMPCPAAGCAFVGLSGLNGAVAIPVVLPAPDLAVDPDTLELWAQVAVRGELDPQSGLFVKLDEAAWERKRQELLARPRPPGEFPFPGAFAADRLFWLRREADEAKPTDALPLWDRLVAADPTAENYRGRAESHRQAGRFDRALRDMLEARRLLPEPPDRNDLMPGFWAAEEIVFKPGLPREHYELALTWYQQTEAVYPQLIEQGLALYHLGRYVEALAVLQRPERDAAARVCAGFMTPLALLELTPALLPPDELRTMAMGLVRLRQGNAAAASLKLARARAENGDRYQTDQWPGYSGVRAAFLAESAKAIEKAVRGKK
jgi:eukaryotic-like serine/threonine-protein kinase